MKKNILIVFTGPMDVGGIEKSLLGLLDLIDYNQYNVDLFLYGHHGPWFQYINENVNLLPEINELAYLRESFATKLKHHAFYSAWRRMIDGIHKVGNDQSWHITMTKFVPEFEKTYDAAIGFFSPYDLIREKVKAKWKIGWIHTDYSSSENLDVSELKQCYKDLDKIVAVSEACRDTFVKVLPEFSDNLMVVENILSKELIYKQSDEFQVDDEMPSDGAVRLLSIGRYCYPKNFDNIPDICAILLCMGLNIKWYLIGFGSDEELIRGKIKSTGMENNVIMLGKKDNPYPYIKNCDLYVQPSRYEGKCVAVREAQMLGKPVVITRYTTSSSQLEDGVDGVIVPLDNEGCANGIASILNKPENMRKLSRICMQRDYSNSKEVEKLYSIFNESLI